MPPPFPSALFLHLHFLLAVALLFIICLPANSTNFTSPFYHQNLRVVRSTPTPRGWHQRIQRSDVVTCILCVLNCSHCNIFFLLRTYLHIQFNNFLIARFSINVHLKRAYFCKVGRKVIMDINMAACQLSVNKGSEAVQLSHKQKEQIADF